MTTTSILSKLAVMAAAAAAPATLFLGAGSAHADIWARAMAAPGGVDVLIHSPNDPADAPSGWCTYSATARGNPIGKPLPAINVPFYLQPGGAARLWFPSYPTGSTWDVRVNCPNTGPQFTQVVW
ncbi:MAG: hypothetical protein AB7G47_12275 [Mycolicibacterium sp.]|uniref:hypothetical protein n=1 Tax=Mycolicibacterium sp. TaxID=2320850 RepID=UPI003D0B1879